MRRIWMENQGFQGVDVPRNNSHPIGMNLNDELLLKGLQFPRRKNNLPDGHRDNCRIFPDYP